MKHHLRKEMKERLAAITFTQAKAKSYAACEALIKLPEFLNARVVMLYLPIPHEMDTAEIALHAWQQGKVVLAPKVNWAQRHMLAVQINSLDDGLEDGGHGVRQPVAGEPWPVEEIGLVIVPALAYDARGGRLGRGGGFYDRFLAEQGMDAVKCGLGFHEQVVDELPMHSHDWPVDLLVTDQCVRRFRENNRSAGPGAASEEGRQA